MASRIFQLCVVFAVVEIFHHAECIPSLSATDDNFIKPPPSRLTSLPQPIDLPSAQTQYLPQSVSRLWAARNTHVDIPCLVRWSTDSDSDRSPAIRWLRDGKPVNASGTTSAHASLRVWATGGAEGYYACLVEYGGGDGTVLSNPIQFLLANMHEFTIHPEDIVVEEGQPAVFFCGVNSNPPANITWQRNSSSISETLSADSYVVLSTGTLLIKKVHSSDVGTYRCKAVNIILNKPRLSKRAKLRLQPKTSIISDAEILANTLELNETVLYGSNLDLYCFARGNPEPIIQWYKDGFVAGNSNILRLFNISEEHSGNYKCIAVNNISTSYQYYTLNVSRPPYFNVTPESMSFPSAKTVRLHCDANGIPTPKISWLKNGRKLDYDGRVKLLQNTLVLSHSFSTDAGIYQCVAESPVGRIWSAARLSITMQFGQPQPPQNVTCRPYEANSICVQWRAPHGLNASAYSVHTTDVETTKMLTEQVTNDTNMIVRQLRPNSTYAFYVRGYVRSASDQSRSVQCATSSVFRRRFTVELVNDSSAWLSWQALSNDVPCTSIGEGLDDGADVWYRLYWRHVSTSPLYHTTSVLGPRYHLTNLIPSTLKHHSRYRFHVEPLATPPNSITINSTTYAHTSSTVFNTNSNKHAAFEYMMPSSSLSNDIIATVYDDEELEEELEDDDEFDEEDDFLPPYDLSVQLIGHDSVLLTWQDDNVGVKFYTVCYAPLVVEGDGVGVVGKQEFKKCTTKSVQVINLHQNTLYEFKVRAHAIDDITSIYSDLIQLNTMDLLSSAVQNLDYFIINSSCVCVTWQQPPYLQNSSYTNYTVAYSIKQKKSEEGWHYISVTSGLDIKQHSCYRSDDSTTLLPFANPIATRRSSDMSLLLSELKPNLNYSLYVQSPGSNPGVTITISTKSAVVSTTVNKEYEYTNDDDLIQMERSESTRREQILGAIVGVCVSVPLLLAVICWFKIWPWWRRRRDEYRRRRQNMPHLNGGTNTAAFSAKTRVHANHNTNALISPNSNRSQRNFMNNNGASGNTYVGNGRIGMRGQHGRSESDDGGGNNTSTGAGKGATAASVRSDGDDRGGVELQSLLRSSPINDTVDAEGTRRSGGLVKNGIGSIHITENPQCTSNGVYTVDSPPSSEKHQTPTPINNSNNINSNSNYIRQLLADNTTISQNIQLLPRRQSPALAPNG